MAHDPIKTNSNKMHPPSHRLTETPPTQVSEISASKSKHNEKRTHTHTHHDDLIQAWLQHENLHISTSDAHKHMHDMKHTDAR